MPRRVFALIVLVSCATFPTAVLAQERVPHTGTTAMGIDVGAFVPRDDQFNNAVLINGLLEYYVTPRVSLRTEFGLADPGLRREPADSLRQVPLRLDVNYNWEGGLNTGGGIEYFINRRVALKGEGRYHVIGNTRAGHDPSGLALTAGLKTYF